MPNAGIAVQAEGGCFQIMTERTIPTIRVSAMLTRVIVHAPGDEGKSGTQGWQGSRRWIEGPAKIKD
jgi:hypothetical protein